MQQNNCDDTNSEIHCKISHSDLLLGSCKNPENVIICCILSFGLSPMKCNKTCDDTNSEIHCKISHSDLLLGSCNTLLYRNLTWHFTLCRLFMKCTKTCNTNSIEIHHKISHHILSEGFFPLVLIQLHQHEIQHHGILKGHMK